MVLWLFALMYLSAVGPVRQAFAQSGNNEDRQGAAEAYDQGVGAYLGGRYVDAAGWFETAHRLSPTAAALQQAVRASLRGALLDKAATLALELRRGYPDNRKACAYADGVLKQLRDQLVFVKVTCQACELTLDGRVISGQTFFVAPNGRHQLSASFADGISQSEFAAEAAGTTVSLTVAPPAPSAGDDPPANRGQPTSADGSWLDDLPQFAPLYTYVALGLTAALVASTVVSGISANARGSSYDNAAGEWQQAGCAQMPVDGQSPSCQGLYDRASARLDRAQSAEVRTNVLLASTLGVSIASAALAYLFTDWSESGATARVDIAVTGSSARADLRVAF